MSLCAQWNEKGRSIRKEIREEKKDWEEQRSFMRVDSSKKKNLLEPGPNF